MRLIMRVSQLQDASAILQRRLGVSMFHRFPKVLVYSLLVIFAGLASASAQDMSLFKLANPQFLAQLSAVSPGFVSDQQKAVNDKFPLFIFVPGIIGSKLVRNGPNGSQTLWGSYNISTPDLSIHDDDDTAIEPSILYDFSVLNIANVEQYASGIRSLTDAELGVELLEQFPYDWRQDNQKTAEKLNDWLCDANRYAKIKDREIRFVAHSMGGLVVKEWFRRYGGTPKCSVAGQAERSPKALNITEVIFLGTPHYGAPKAIKALASGFKLVATDFGGILGMLGGMLDKNTIGAALNQHGVLFPSVYQLLPIYHEHEADCMDAYAIKPDDWPPRIASISGTNDKFAVFSSQSWKRFSWPAYQPQTMSSDAYYKFLDKTLSEARTFLCRLAQYKFPDGVEIRYFASDTERTAASFQIKKKGYFTTYWDLEDQQLPNWSKGDGTVPQFIARNRFSLGQSNVENHKATERKTCGNAHSDLLNCEEFGKYVREEIAAAKGAQAQAAARYLEKHPNEKQPVLQKFGSANVYFDCGLSASDVVEDASYSRCPVNDAILEKTGKSLDTLLAEVKAAPKTSDKQDKLAVLAGMQGLDSKTRIDAAEYSAIAALEAGQLNTARITLAQLAGNRTEPIDTIASGNRVFVDMPLSNRLVAVNVATTPSVSWTKVAAVEPHVIPVMCCDSDNKRTIALQDGKVFWFDAETTKLTAIEAETGKELWAVRTGDPKKGEAGGTVPYIFDGKVVVGVSGAEFGGRETVVAYDIETGKRKWRSYSAGPDNQILFDPMKTMADGRPVGKDFSLKTWTGDQWKISSGRQTSGIVFDPDLKLMYLVVENDVGFHPQRNDQTPGGLTLFARDIDTGTAKWIYNIPGDGEWDDINKADLKITEDVISGETRQVIEYSDKRGNFLSLDRESGELLKQSKTPPPKPAPNATLWLPEPQ